MSRREKKKRKRGVNGFEEWGGYMNAKITKLEDQFNEEFSHNKNARASNIFEGISIFVNGYTEPSADELRCLMLQHGGVYHHYYRSGKTTHIIASNLPNSKFNQMKSLKVVRSEWITESIKSGKLLDYKNFLLFNNFSGHYKMKTETISALFASKEGTRADEQPKTAADDGYLNDFYNNSRLHYISQLKIMFKEFIQDLKDNHNGVFLGRKNLLLTHKTEIDLLSDDHILPDSNVIMHLDLDCFFVSVALRKYPHLKGKPVAVTHSTGNAVPCNQDVDRKFEVKYYRNRMKAKINPKKMEVDSESDEESIEEWSKELSSMSEIASCSYEARKMGVYKGMYLGAALKLCPNLITVPYDFEGYKEVSMILYKAVAQYTLDVEAISCDELFIDCTSLITELKISPLKFAETLRREIYEKTNCTASAGIGSNKLQARLATKRAKPNGQFYLMPDNVKDFMKELDVHDLPGVGRTIGGKLKILAIKTCEDLQKVALTTLKKEFGEKTGEMLYKCCRGIDERRVISSYERKSVSAEVNYGIRFNDDQETENFLKQLSKEVSKRLKDAKMMGRAITFKVMFRAKDAPKETAKFLGHGVCDQINRSVGLPSSTNESNVIANHVISLYYQLHIPANDLRGIGIQITKLEPEKKTSKPLQAYFEQNKQLVNMPSTSRPTKITEKANKGLPQIDFEVMAALPDEIRSEILKDFGLTNLQLNDLKKDNNNDSKNNDSKNICDRIANVNNNLGNKKNYSMLGMLDLDDESQSFRNLSTSEMRLMIKEWVAAEHQPKFCDIKMFESYLTNLTEQKKLEEISLIMKCLHRQVKTKQNNNDVWNTTYQEMVDVVQSSMKKTYGKLLSLESISYIS